MDGLRKTALFLSGLEPNAVDRLLGRLDPEDAKAVRREIMSLGNVSEAESSRVAVEFLEASGGRQKSTVVAEICPEKPSSGFYGRPLPKAQQKSMRFPVEAFEPRTRRPFDFLSDIEPETVGHEISSEHPQAICVVLANIPQRKAAEILQLLPSPLQNEVARRMAEYDPVDELIVTEIAAALRERFENFRNDFSVLERLDNADLSRLFHAVDIETAVLALVGAKASLIERIVQRFTPTEEHEFRRQLKRLGTIDERDVRQARQTILQTLVGVRREERQTSLDENFFTPHTHAPHA